MLRPILFVGLGGAGGKTLRAIREGIDHDLENAGWQGNFPGSFQFLHIDLEDQSNSDYLAPPLPADQFCKLVPLGATYHILRSNLESRFRSDSEKAKMLGGWLLFETYVSVNFGSGTIRSVGRCAFVNALSNVVQMLRQSVLQIQSKDASEELSQISNLICGGSQSGARDLTPRVVIVTSLIGGTGSAIYVDFLETLRRLVPSIAGEAPVSLLYEANIFSTHIPRAVKSSLGSNMLATLDEIANFSINGVGTSTSELLESLALPPANMDYRDKSSKIIIGATPGAVSLSSEEVFKSVGKKVAKVALSPEDSKSLFSSPLIPEDPDLSPQDFSGRVMALSSLEFSSFVWFLPGYEGYYGSLPSSRSLSLGFSESTGSRELHLLVSKLRSLSLPERQTLALSSRARPLLESMPIKVDVVTQLLAGWVILFTFGLIKHQEGWWVRNPYSAAEDGWMELLEIFPDREKIRGRPISLLENFSLAAVLNELLAYEFILEVGGHVFCQNVEIDKNNLPETDLLRRFVYGRLPDGISIRTVDRDVFEHVDSEDGRKAQLISFLTQAASRISDALEEEESHQWQDRSRLGEISEHYLTAISLVKAYVTKVATHLTDADSGEFSSLESGAVFPNDSVKQPALNRFLIRIKRKDGIKILQVIAGAIAIRIILEIGRIVIRYFSG